MFSVWLARSLCALGFGVLVPDSDSTMGSSRASPAPGDGDGGLCPEGRAGSVSRGDCTEAWTWARGDCTGEVSFKMIPQIARIQGKAKGQTEGQTGGQTGGERKGREEIGKVKRKGMRENKETGQKGSREVRGQGRQLKKFIWKQEGKRENEAVGREGGSPQSWPVYCGTISYRTNFVKAGLMSIYRAPSHSVPVPGT